MLKNILLATPLIFLSGCCISFIDDTCVIVKKVPGPTKIVYKKSPKINLPAKPNKLKKISFKKIIFDKHVYYGVDRNGALNILTNSYRRDEYCKRLENLIE